MDDLTPTAIARQIPATATLLEAREQLSNLLKYMDGKVAAEDQIKKLLNDPQLMQSLRDRVAEKAEPDEEDKSGDK
jgi:type VI secretion system protein ImpB